VDSAVNAGADCVQLQIFDTAANMAPSSPLYSLLEKIYFSPEQWRELMAYARGFDIHVSIFAYDEPSLELALELRPDMIKLNSSELANPPMLIGAARSGLPFTVGTGASTLEEIRRAVDIALEHGGDSMILMHGVQNFPTPVESANIRKIRHLKDEFGGLVIFADHTDANSGIAHWIDLAAIGQGAALLEKHLILDRSSQGVDWQAALEPAEFKSYVAAMRQGWAAMGPYDFQPFGEGERKYRRFQKKSMVAARDIAQGEPITMDKVKFLRVQGEQEGIAPIDFSGKAEGLRTLRAFNIFEQILPDDLA
jgi:sialic acid synthase SpsE